MRTKTVFRACYREQVSHCQLRLAKSQWQLVKWESFIVEKRKALCVSRLGSCWPGEAVGGPIGVVILCDLIGVYSWLLWLASSWKWGQQLGKLSVTNQILAIRG